MLAPTWQYHRGDIYLANLDPVRGSEQGGIRPVVVLQNDLGNHHSPTLIVAAVTSQQQKKHRLPTHYRIKQNAAFSHTSVVLLEQLRTIDKSRIIRYAGAVTQREMWGIERALIISLALESYVYHFFPKRILRLFQKTSHTL